MQRKQDYQLQVDIFINSFKAFGREAVQSKRMMRIFQAYTDLVSINVFDINQEIVRARQEFSVDESAKQQMSRVDIANAYGLLKSGTDPSDVTLPQAFLSKLTADGSCRVERDSLGHMKSVQVLADSGILRKILTQEICPHIRNFQHFTFYHYYQHDTKEKAKKVCTKCYMRLYPEIAERVVLVGNFGNPKCATSHDLAIFFENNKIAFSSYDPCNAHLSKKSLEFLQSHGIPEEPVTDLRVWINQKEYRLDELVELARQNLLLSIINKRRCAGCMRLLQSGSWTLQAPIYCKNCQLNHGSFKEKVAQKSQKFSKINCSRGSGQAKKLPKSVDNLAGQENQKPAQNTKTKIGMGSHHAFRPSSTKTNPVAKQKLEQTETKFELGDNDFNQSSISFLNQSSFLQNSINFDDSNFFAKTIIPKVKNQEQRGKDRQSTRGGYRVPYAQEKLQNEIQIFQRKSVGQRHLNATLKSFNQTFTAAQKPPLNPSPLKRRKSPQMNRVGSKNLKDGRP